MQKRKNDEKIIHIITAKTQNGRNRVGAIKLFFEQAKQK